MPRESTSVAVDIVQGPVVVHVEPEIVEVDRAPSNPATDILSTPLARVQMVTPTVGPGMSDVSVSIRQLANDASRIVRDVTETGLPRIITKHGRAVAIIAPIDDDKLAAVLLKSLPDLVEGLEDALQERASGKGTDLDDVEAE